MADPGQVQTASVEWTDAAVARLLQMEAGRTKKLSTRLFPLVVLLVIALDIIIIRIDGGIDRVALSVVSAIGILFVMAPSFIWSALMTMQSASHVRMIRLAEDGLVISNCLLPFSLIRRVTLHDPHGTEPCYMAVETEMGVGPIIEVPADIKLSAMRILESQIVVEQAAAPIRLRRKQVLARNLMLRLKKIARS